MFPKPIGSEATPAVGGYPKQPPPAALRQAQVAAQVADGRKSLWGLSDTK